MKKALMISYPFPPTGGPGVQRSLKFVKYLGNFGWEPVVLTREVGNMKLKDDSLEKDIPKDTRIYRTNPWELTELPSLFGLAGKFVSIKLLIPDKERLWEIFSKRTAARIVKHEGIDLIYSTSVPYSSHLLGLHLKKRFPDIPWVADFRDEWTNNPYLLDNPHYRLRMNMEKRMEKKVLEKADCLITNTPVMLENFLCNNPALNLEDRFFVISNGYDRDDFGQLVKNDERNTRFTITYTGSFYGRRKPDTFFQALHELMEEGMISNDKIAVRLIGLFKEEYIKELCEKFNLRDIVRVTPYIPHEECIKRMVESDALLLIEGGGPGGEAFYTGKVFEYMVAGRPIIAIVPEKGAAARLIEETRTGYISDFNDIIKTKENLRKLYISWLEDKVDFNPDFKQIARYDRKVLTEELSKVFEKSCRLVAARKMVVEH